MTFPARAPTFGPGRTGCSGGRPTVVRILVAEDDAGLGGVLVRGLREQGYVVDLVPDGETAAMYLRFYQYEAAVIDGCTEWSAFWRVMLPLARPGLVTVAIFQFIGVWKEYFFAFMLVSGDTDGGARTLPLGLANLSITAQYRSDYGMLFAGIVLVTLPILLIYILLQRHIVKGVAAGALKG